MILAAGIFAAGEGKRMRKFFPGTIKSLVEARGKSLIEWMIFLLENAGAKKISVLLNSRGLAAMEKIKSGRWKAEFDFVVKDTSSSWESFSLLSKRLAEKHERFLLMAVDSFCKPADLEKMARAFPEADMVLGVTSKIRDEKPLWAAVGPKGEVLGVGKNSPEKKFATAGVYVLSSALCREMPPPGAHNALRNYLEDLSAGGKKIFAVKMTGNADVDDAGDLREAEKFIDEFLIRRQFM